jgi:PAS domain S-box-containing protein
MEIDLGQVLNALPAMVWTALPDGHINFVNRRWSEYTGLRLDEAHGWEWQAAVNPDDLAGLIERWRSIVASGDTGEMEARVRRFDGQYRWFLIRVSPLADTSGQLVKWCGINTDIDERRRAEEDLRAIAINFRKSETALKGSEARKSAILDSALDCIVTIDHDGRITEFNPAAERTFGCSRDAVVGKHLADIIIPPVLREKHRQGLDRYLATGEARVLGRRLELMAVRGDGSEFPVELAITRIPLDGPPSFTGYLRDITDRKRAEEALRESDRQSRLIVDTIPALVAVFGPNGEVEGLNEQFLEYLGQTLEEFASWPTNGTVHPDDLPRHIETLTQSLNSGHPIDFETRLRRFDGAYRWFQLRGHAARDADGRIVRWYCLMSDIDDRKRAEEELRRSEAFLADAQRLSRTGSFSWRIATQELTWSEETYRIYELDPGVPVSFDLIRTRVHPDNLASLQEVMDRARREGGDFDYETRLLMPDHSVKYLRVVAHSDRNKDGELGLRGAVQDVTERRLADEALGRLRSELAHVTRVTSLGALTASIAHEVNQPLSGIITNAGTCLRMLAADPPNVEGARETARRTIRDGNRAADVISRLRALFSGKTATIEPVDLNEAAREVIALSSGDLQRSRIVLRTELDDGLSPVAGDRVQLQQVILNLLRNASDAMGGVEDRPRQLVIRTEPDEGDHVRLTVRDAGIGFDPHSADRLFEAFYTTKSDGMGMGLSVSRSIIERHQGRLWAQPNDGPGATFAFSIPHRFERPNSAFRMPAMTDAQHVIRNP